MPPARAGFSFFNFNRMEEDVPHRSYQGPQATFKVGFLPRPFSLSGDHDPRLADIKALRLTHGLAEDYAWPSS